MSGPRVRLLIRTDGSSEVLPANTSMDEVRRLIGADAIDTVALHHLGQPLHVMLVDDNGWETETVEIGNQIHLKPVRARKPVNKSATSLYWLNCQPGTTHQIVGDVVVLPDEDFA
jgi:hypothetical protein